jgi:hypothetical protein
LIARYHRHMKKFFLAVLMLGLVGGGVGWWMTRVKRAITGVHETFGDRYDIGSWKVLASHTDDPNAYYALVRGLELRTNTCVRGTTDEPIDVAIEGLTKHPPSGEMWFKTLARARGNYQNAAKWKPLLDAAGKDPQLRPALLGQVRYLAANYCTTALDETLEDLLTRAEKIAPLTDDEGRAALLRYKLREVAPPAPIKKRLDVPADDDVEGRALVRLVAAETSVEGIDNAKEMDRFIAIAGPIWAKKPPPFSDKAIETIAFWAKNSWSPAIGLGRILPPAAQKQVAAQGAPPGFMSSLAVTGNAKVDAMTELFASLISRDDKEPDYQKDSLYINRIPKVQDRDTAAYEAAMALGHDAVKPLLKSLSSNQPRSVFTAARALAKLDPAALVEAAMPAFGTFDTGVKMKFSAGMLADSSLVPSATLVALKDVKGEAADVAFFRALSSPDPSMASYATQALDQRLSGEGFVDGVLRFLSRRTEFDAWELTQVENAIVAKKGAGPAVARNLKRLLDEQGGDPARVFWALKIVSLKACARVCGKDAVPVLEKYALDGGAFSDVKTQTRNGQAVGTPTKTSVSFASLAQTALAHAKR